MPRNERLHDALARAGVTPTGLAERLDVDPKTVERWIAGGRTPYRRHRQDVARALQADETWLWPDATNAVLSGDTEIRRIHAHRFEISIDQWVDFFRSAEDRIDVLVFAGLFLPEQTPDLCALLLDSAKAGVAVRLILGDPDCDAVRVRGLEEGIGDAVAVKIRNSLNLYRPLANTPVQVRLHSTTLYTSIYRSDDEMIASPHVLGLPGARSPALHLRQQPRSELFDTYAACFDRVWTSAKPAWTEE